MDSLMKNHFSKMSDFTSQMADFFHPEKKIFSKQSHIFIQEYFQKFFSPSESFLREDVISE